MRKGWKIVWSDGTEWLVDCVREMHEHKRAGRHTIVPIRIMGKKRSLCGACAMGMHSDFD
jgi:hypothetical protein